MFAAGLVHVVDAAEALGLGLNESGMVCRRHAELLRGLVDKNRYRMMCND
jgi:hypothetical protein